MTLLSKVAIFKEFSRNKVNKVNIESSQRAKREGSITGLVPSGWEFVGGC